MKNFLTSKLLKIVRVLDVLRQTLKSNDILTYIKIYFCKSSKQLACNLTDRPLSFRVWFLTSTPIVLMKVLVDAESSSFSRMHDFPTPESPTITNL